MNKKIFTLLLSLSYSTYVFANEPFFSLEFSEGTSQTFNSEKQTDLRMTALRNFKLTDLVIDSGQCPFTLGDAIFGQPYYRLSDHLGNFPIAGVSYSPEKTFGIKVGCNSDEIKEIVITTDKGIQTIKFNVDTKPVISVKPLSDKVAVFDKKAESQPLNELYTVSNYTCYQGKNSLDEVVEYCTPLPVRNLDDFNLPSGKLMSKALFFVRAEENARRARYIEFVETLPEQLPTFKAKRLPSVPTLSEGSVINPKEVDYEKELHRAETRLDSQISRYEKNLLDFVHTRIKNTEREKKLEADQQALARVKKALSTEPSERLKRNIEDLERSILWTLGQLENIAINLPKMEAGLVKDRQRVQENKENILRIRSILENNQ